MLHFVHQSGFLVDSDVGWMMKDIDWAEIASKTFTGLMAAAFIFWAVNTVCGECLMEHSAELTGDAWSGR